MNERPNTIYLERNPYMDGVAFHIAYKDHQGILNVAQPLIFERREPHTITNFQPCMVLDFKTAQRVMDELWQCGLRPSEGTGSAGALAATQKHLDDMRQLVFEEKTIIREDRRHG